MPATGPWIAESMVVGYGPFSDNVIELLLGNKFIVPSSTRVFIVDGYTVLSNQCILVTDLRCKKEANHQVYLTK